MKAVIVEIKESFVAVLSDDGCISKVRNNNYEIGQVIELSKQKINISRKFVAFAASAATFFMLCGVGAWAYTSPYSYVSLDVNPSIEFSINRFDRVLSVKAVNDDGLELLKELDLSDLKNKTIEQALSQTIDQISTLGYFDGDLEGGIVISTSGENSDKATDLAEELQISVEQEVEGNGDNVIVEAMSVGLERVHQAQALGVTPGKLHLVEKLQASAADPTSFDLETWLNKPVKEIMQATKENKKADKKESVSGSAITLEENDNDKKAKVEDKADNNAKDTLDKASNKPEKETEKSNKSEEIDANKAKDAKDDNANNSLKGNDKAIDKAQKAKDSGEKVKETEEKAKEAEINADKNSEKEFDENMKQDNREKSPGQKTTDKETKNSDRYNKYHIDK